MKAVRWLPWLAAACLAACAVGTLQQPPEDVAQMFTEAQDPAGRAAWEQAQQRLASGDRAGALPLLRTAIEACPNLVRAHLAYQDAALAVGADAQKAMLDYYRKLPDGASPVPAYCRARLADTSYTQGTALQAIVARHPYFSWAHLSLARVTRRKGQLLQAVDSFAAALRYDPTLYEAHLERALVLVELGRGEEAAVDFDAYLAKVPGDDRARLAYAELAIYHLGRVDRGRELLGKLDASHGGDVAVQLDRAAAAWLGKDPRAAVDGYLAVLSAHPEEARALLNVGLLYYEVLPRTAGERALYWPKARAAFQLFLAGQSPRDGHEQFERTLGVPYRLEVIAEAIGPATGGAPTLADLRLPAPH